MIVSFFCIFPHPLLSSFVSCCPHTHRIYCSCDLCGLNTKRRALDQIERQMKNTSTTIGIGVKKYNELNHTNSNADESNAINHDDIVSASAMDKIGDHRSSCHG